MDHVYEGGTVSTTPTPFPVAVLTGFPVSTGKFEQETKPGSYWFYMVVEEILSVIKEAGLVPDYLVVNQMAQAISIIVDRLAITNHEWVGQKADVLPVVFDTTHTAILDLHKSNYFQLSNLSANSVLADPINIELNQCGVIIVTQDALGGRQLAYGPKFEFVGGEPPVLSVAPYSTDVLVYVTMPNGKVRISVMGGNGDAGAAPTVLPAGALIGQFCSGVNLMGTYADGVGGTFDQLIQANSLDCGYIPYVPGSQQWTVPGTYSFVVPAAVYSIPAVLHSGGGGGGGSSSGQGGRASGGGGGGGGAGAVTTPTIAVTPGETLTVIVPSGGGGGLSAGMIGSSNGLAGGTGGSATILRGATVLATIAGGTGGGGGIGGGGGGGGGTIGGGAGSAPDTSGRGWGGAGGKSSYAGSGAGGYGGAYSYAGGTGGMGSGGGGGGSSGWSPNDTETAGGAGGPGIVSIVW